MKLAKVIGTVVATQKEPKLEGLRYLVLRNYGPDNTPEAGSVVAVDAVGAGVDEMVLYASGSSARQTVATDKRAGRRRGHGDRRYLGDRRRGEVLEGR